MEDLYDSFSNLSKVVVDKHVTVKEKKIRTNINLFICMKLRKAIMNICCYKNECLISFTLRANFLNIDVIYYVEK